MVRRNGRNHGEVFTDGSIVSYILDEVGYKATKNLNKVRILEPAAGTGAFAFEIIDRLYASAIKYKFSFNEALKSNVRFVELNKYSFNKLKKHISAHLKKLKCKDSDLTSIICICEDFLIYESQFAFDCVVGNPPYIRNELITIEKREVYKKKFKTFKFRADLYILFFEHSLGMLGVGGKLSFVCSNRWLKNQYGKPLREMISSRFNLVKILNIEKSSPFDEKVNAYPCITTIENNLRKSTMLYSEDHSKVIDFRRTQFKEMENPKNSSWQNLFLPYDLDHGSLIGIVDQGFEIGIGVATGIDRVFIKNKIELNGIEKSRLLPLVTSQDLRGNQLKWSQNYLINPYVGNELCNLDDFPHLKNYFIKNKSALTRRHLVKKMPEKWYKTIDKIKPELRKKPKILLPDLTGNKVLIIDEGNYYPHHNLYFITGKSIGELKILAGILMSDFIRDQISKIGIRMNGGLPRFQSQTLKKLRIPIIKSFSNKLKEDLTSAYDLRDIKVINFLIDNYCLENGILSLPDLEMFSSKLADKTQVDLFG